MQLGAGDYVFLALLAANGVMIMFGGIVCLWDKYKPQSDDPILLMSDVEKEYLIRTTYREAEGLPVAVIAPAWFCMITNKSKRKIGCMVVYYNKFYKDAKYEIVTMTVQVPREEYEKHNLKLGDYVGLKLSWEKRPEIVFD